MPANEPLRKAMADARVSIEALARAVGVHAKTVQRWLGGRTPHPRHRWAVADLLGVREATLWPDAKGEALSSATSTSEILAAYAHRADVPSRIWHDLFDQAKTQIDLLGYALLFLPEANPRLTIPTPRKSPTATPKKVSVAPYPAESVPPFTTSPTSTTTMASRSTSTPPRCTTPSSASTTKCSSPHTYTPSPATPRPSSTFAASVPTASSTISPSTSSACGWPLRQKSPVEVELSHGCQVFTFLDRVRVALDTSRNKWFARDRSSRAACGSSRYLCSWARGFLMPVMLPAKICAYPICWSRCD